ncbi:uncharacterized protein LODBEIA_P50670 [Lodderomyces beijingensis]|uniref:Calnexin n=1 Tax=Lodderomyces beijingensis TaxID=1775926 RepID=A0ABP0ZRR0_9ASCO
MAKPLYIALLVLATGVGCLEFEPYDKSKLHPSSIFEQFSYTSLAESPWRQSKAKKYDEGRDEIVAYTGEWSIAEPYLYPGLDNDFGLVMGSRAAYHSIAYKLPHSIDNQNGKDLVIQYEVKVQNGWTCSGAYIKLLNQAPNYSFFNCDTAYQIQFGPDHCGSDNRVHLVLSKQLQNGTVEDKVLQTPPLARINELTNLYTLILRPAREQQQQQPQFEIRINGETVITGDLVEGVGEDLFQPPIFPPKWIVDPSDKKPASWDDRISIPDPNVKPPPGYEEKHAHPQIPDPDAVKPKEWMEDEPRYIPDPNAVPPVVGANGKSQEWSPPLVVNPKCSSGCGKWSPPMIINKEYKGPWFAPEIDNPNYQGIWQPRKIPNPDYYQVVDPVLLDKPIGGIGFELWTMDGDVLFDNVYLGNYVEEAEDIGNKTFKIKSKLEYSNKLQNAPKIQNEPTLPPRNFDEIIRDDSIGNMKQFVVFLRLLCWKQYMDFKDFVYEALLDPVRMAVKHPLKTSIYVSIILFSITITCGVGSVLLFLLQSGGLSSKTLEEEYEEENGTQARRSDDGDDIVIMNRNFANGDVETLEETLQQGLRSRKAAKNVGTQNKGGDEEEEEDEDEGIVI